MTGSPRTGWRDALAVAVALVALGALTVLNQRQVNPTHPVTYSTYDAAGGGYRAWYELLEREGVAVARFEERAAFLDAPIHSLIVADPAPPAFAGPVAKTDGDAIARWVRAGGVAIVLGDGFVVDILRSALHLPNTTDKFSRNVRPSISAELAAAGIGRLSPVGALRVRARPSDAVLAADRRGVLIVRYRLGNGAVVYAVDGAAFSNEAIATPDRARLALALATGPEVRQPVWFDEAIHGYIAAEHWWDVLPRRFVIALLAALAVLALALVGAAIRLGPPLLPARHRDATSAEYLDALATLYERVNAIHNALREVLRSTKRTVASALGAGDEASAGELAARMPPAFGARMMRLDSLAANPRPSRAELLAGVELAFELRKEYGRYGRGR